MQELKQSTEIKVRVGSFVSQADGFTPVTTITLGAADEAELLKNNGVATVDISGSTFAAISNCDGWYDLTLSVTDTNTLGLVTVVIQDDSEILPVFIHFMIVTANYFDTKYSTDKFQVDVQEVSGASVSGVNDFKADVSGIEATLGTPASGDDIVGTLGDIQTETDKIQTIDDNIDTILIDTNDIQGKLPNNNIMGSSVKTDKDDEIDSIKSTVDANLDATVSSRSSHSVADIWSYVTRTLTSIGSLADDVWTSNASGIGRTLTEGTKDSEIDAIKTKTDNLPADPTSETNATANKSEIIVEVDANEVKLDLIQVDLDNPNQYKADISTLATEANATSNKDEIIVEVDANETKIDSVITTLSTIVADIWSYVTRTLTSIGSLADDVWTSNASGIGRTLTEGTKDSEIDNINSNLTSHRTETENRIKYILGLSQSNYIISSPVYDGNGNLTSATIKTYPTATDANNDTNVLKTYNVVATYNGTGTLATYKVTEV